MELVIAKQSKMSPSECANYVVPEDMWARFKFECCYPEGRGTIAKGGILRAQMSMENDTVIIKESGQFAVCVIGANTKSSIYVELIQEAEAGTIIVEGGRNVTVDKSESDGNTIYTVNAKDDDSRTVIEGGDNIQVTSSTVDNVTTWTITGEAGGSNTVVAAGDNVTVTKSTSGGVDTYTVNAADQGSHTVVRAGENVTVTPSTEGNKTVYTVGATVPPPVEARTYKVTSANTETLTVAETMSGTTTTFTLTAVGADVEISSTDPNLIITKR